MWGPTVVPGIWEAGQEPPGAGTDQDPHPVQGLGTADLRQGERPPAVVGGRPRGSGVHSKPHWGRNWGEWHWASWLPVSGCCSESEGPGEAGGQAGCFRSGWTGPPAQVRQEEGRTIPPSFLGKCADGGLGVRTESWWHPGAPGSAFLTQCGGGHSATGADAGDAAPPPLLILTHTHACGRPSWHTGATRGLRGHEAGRQGPSDPPVTRKMVPLSGLAPAAGWLPWALGFSTQGRQG